MFVPMKGSIPPMLLGVLASILRAGTFDIGISIVGPGAGVQNTLIRTPTNVIDVKHGRAIVVVLVGIEGKSEGIAQSTGIDLHAGPFRGARVPIVALTAKDGIVVSISRRIRIVVRNVAVGSKTDDLAKECICGLFEGQALVVLDFVAQTIPEGQVEHAIRSEGNVPAVVVVTHLHGRLEEDLLVLHVHLQRTLVRAGGIAQQRESAEDVDGTLPCWKFVDVPFPCVAVSLADGGVVRVDPHGVIALFAALSIEIRMECNPNQASTTIVAHEGRRVPNLVMSNVGLVGGPGGARHGVDGAALLAHEEEVGSVGRHVEVGRGRHSIDEDLRDRLYTMQEGRWSIRCYAWNRTGLGLPGAEEHTKNMYYVASKKIRGAPKQIRRACTRRRGGTSRCACHIPL